MAFPHDLVAATLDAQMLGVEMRLGRAAGAGWIEGAARRRRAALVAYARERSPFYRELYRGIPLDAPLTALPIARKRDLMAHFDEWATDPRIRRDGVERFLADPEALGKAFLHRFTVWTSSGTTGEPGIYVQDEAAMSVYDALVMAQADPREWGPRELGRIARSGGRSALVVATGAPFPAVAAWQRLARMNPALGGGIHSITLPMPKMVDALNRDGPAFLSTYPTMALLLALERTRGHLAIEPAAIWCGGECLSAYAREAIELAFDCRVHDEYGAAECFSIGSACPLGAMHYHADWVILEPIDQEGRVVPSGEPSHSVLLTNLANRLQPIIRYDLGDSIRMTGQTCGCGSPLPVIEVQGRSDDVLALAAPDGRPVAIVPLALETVIEAALGAVPFQLVATGPRELRLRLPRSGAAAPRPHARRACHRALHAFLVAHGLPGVKVADDPGEPAIDARTGKLRRILALPA